MHKYFLKIAFLKSLCEVEFITFCVAFEFSFYSLSSPILLKKKAENKKNKTKVIVPIGSTNINKIDIPSIADISVAIDIAAKQIPPKYNTSDCMFFIKSDVLLFKKNEYGIFIYP